MAVLCIPTYVANVVRAGIQHVHRLIGTEVRIGSELERHDPCDVGGSKGGAPHAPTRVIITDSNYIRARRRDVLAFAHVGTTLIDNVVVRALCLRRACATDAKCTRGVIARSRIVLLQADGADNIARVARIIVVGQLPGASIALLSAVARRCHRHYAMLERLSRAA